MHPAALGHNPVHYARSLLLAGTAWMRVCMKVFQADLVYWSAHLVSHANQLNLKVTMNGDGAWEKRWFRCMGKILGFGSGFYLPLSIPVTLLAKRSLFSREGEGLCTSSKKGSRAVKGAVHFCQDEPKRELKIIFLKSKTNQKC